MKECARQPIKQAKADVCITFHLFKKCRGITLIEILIALSIGLLILSFLFEIYMTVLHSFKMQMALQAVENNANKTIDLLRSEIRKAGFIGCAHLSDDFPIRSHTPFTLNNNNKLLGNNERLTVRYVNFKSKLIEDMHSARQLLVTRARFKRGDTLLISDCKKAEIFQVSEVHRNQHQEKMTLAIPLHDKFTAGAEIGLLEINEYFLASAKHKTNQDKQFSLFKKDIRGYQIELIEGLKDMKIRYSIQKNHRLIDQPAREIDSFAQVRAVAIVFHFFLGDRIKTWYLYSSLRTHG